MIKLGLALGGGGARGLAHVGVLKVFEREQIPIYAITGCSMGSIIGGLYAYFNSADKVEAFIHDAVENPEFKKYGIDTYNRIESSSYHESFEQYLDYIKVKLSFLKVFNNQSVFNNDETDKLFSFLPDGKIEDLPVKFSAIATDLISGKEVNITKGSLRKALKASAAIPGIFPPVKLDDYLLIDGSASESVPVNRVKELGAERVIAVDVIKSLKNSGPLNNGIEIIYRAEEITSYYLSQERLIDADLIIKPNVRDLSWADFVETDKIIKEGETAAEKLIDRIKGISSKGAFTYGVQKFFEKIKQST